MNKKPRLTAALLALLLLAGCGASPAGEEGSDPAPPAESDGSGAPACYEAYAGIVREYQQKYGPECIRQIDAPPDRLNCLMGVCVVRLPDFDLDGTPELLLAWPESGDPCPSYRYALWTSPDGTTAEQVCENDILDGIQSYCPSMKLVRRADGAFLGQEAGNPGAAVSYAYRGLTSDGLNVCLSLINMPSFPEEDQYLVDGRPVSTDEFLQAEADFLTGAEVEQISFSLADYEDPAPLAETVRATQEALELLGIAPNEAGREVEAAPSQPGQTEQPEQTEQADYGPYLELIDQYLTDYGQPQVLSSSWFDGRDDTPALGGLCVVRLVDLNGDGTEELILAYVQSLASVGRNIYYGFDIWTLRDGEAQELIRASIPYSAYEPSMMFYAGQPESYMAISYDTNTGQVTSIANVEYYFSCYGYDGESLVWRQSRSELPEGVRETEYIYFSSYSYRWAAGMDWAEDSQRVIGKTLDTIDSLRASSQ